MTFTEKIHYMVFPHHNFIKILVNGLFEIFLQFSGFPVRVDDNYIWGQSKIYFLLEQASLAVIVSQFL